MFKTFTIALFILIGSSSAAAQQRSTFLPGYVVVASGDTLRGEVQDRIDLENARGARFRRAGEETVAYGPQEALAYGFEGGRRFELKTLAPGPDTEVEPLFLQVLVEGEVSLYAFSLPSPHAFGSLRDDYHIDPDRYAIERSGTVTALYIQRQWGASTSEPLSVDRQYARALGEAFAECPTEARLLGQLRFARRNLARAVTRFNACIGAETTVASAPGMERRRDVRTHLSLRVGGGPSQSTFGMWDAPGYRVLLEGVADARLLTLGGRYSIPMTLGLGRTIALPGRLPPGHQAGDLERSRLAFSMGGRYRFVAEGPTASVAAGRIVSYLPGSDRFAYSPMRQMGWETGWFVEFGGDVPLPHYVGAANIALRYEAIDLHHIASAFDHIAWPVSSVYGVLGVRF